MRRNELFAKVIAWFEENMPDPKTELNYTNAYELLVAVVLSAQCTDKRVNIVTPNFFKLYSDVFSLSKASIEDIFHLISSISYPNSKSKHLSSMSQILVSNFNGEIPSEVDKLILLPGVGRKTANVLVSVLFNKPAMAVDTHVFRVSARLGLTLNAKTPLEAEKQLIKYIPEEKIAKAHHWLILHGRYVCVARKPKCEFCGLFKYCKYANEFFLREQK